VSVAIGSGAIVTSSQTFTVSCSDRVDLNALIGPPASFIGPVAASWSGSCTGDAVDTECVLRGPLPPVSTVVLECGCDVRAAFGFASTCGGPFPSPSPFQN
jgi:hypothetical protein